MYIHVTASPNKPTCGKENDNLHHLDWKRAPFSCYDNKQKHKLEYVIPLLIKANLRLKDYKK